MSDVRLDELRLRWEEARRRGDAPSAEELCRDCPELTDHVRELVGLWGLAPPGGEGSWGLRLDATGPAAATPPSLPLTLQAGAEPVPGYLLTAFLGEGSFGQVWKATGPGGVPVALKFISTQGAAAEARSLELMKQLRHPHLLALFGVWQQGGRLIVAMELADGTLADRLKQCLAGGLGGIPAAELVEYLHEAGKGIDYLNEPRHNLDARTGASIQHRDVKPANLLLVGGSVKVGDFGLAKLIEHTRSGNTLSFTVAYAAPEFFHGSVAHQSDQYSLAVTYCQLRGGRLPFIGSLAQLTAGHLHEPPDLSMLPDAERPAVARALAKTPAERWPSCRAFAQALAAVAVGSLPKADAAPPAPQASTVFARSGPSGQPVAADTAAQPGAMTTAKPAGGRKAPWLIAAAALLVVAVGVALWRSSDGDPPTPPGKGGDVQAKGPDKGGDVQQPKGEVVNSIGIKLVLVPAGKFQMGSPPSEPSHRDAEWLHEVEITRPFYIGAFEVTQTEYEKVMGRNPSRWREGNGGGPDHPVDNVTWEDAVAFCEKLSALPEERKAGRVYRLPTEAQWEYACRGGPAATTDPFPHGKSLSARQANINGAFPYGGADNGPYKGHTEKVGSYKPNALGLYDMIGNVWEWCADWYDPDYYKKSPRKDPVGPDASPTNIRALRSGSWNDPGETCRAAYRNPNPPNAREGLLGFRVVSPISPGAP